MNWPIGKGKQFTGVYDRAQNHCLIFSKASTGGAQKADISVMDLNRPELLKIVDASEIATLKEELELLDIAGNLFDEKAFLAGDVTPVFFASALTNFGVEPFFDAFIHMAPSPRARLVDRVNGEEILLDPVETPFSAYVFKIQANMNKKHRDSMAFLRICSGKFEKDLVVKHHRLKREVRLSRPHGMVAGERSTIEAAYAGDIIGIINPGLFSVGDSVSLTGDFNFKPLPQFQPEIFAKVTPKEIGKRKSFDKGVMQLTEEGTVQLLRTRDVHGDTLFAAVGKLQFEVMQYRLQDEYGVETNFTMLPYKCSAWLIGDLTSFRLPTNALIVDDRFGRPMVLFGSQWEKDYAMKQNPNHKLTDLIA